MTPKGEKLSNRERMFVEEYLTDWNGTRAAIAAGYSKRSASVIAVENLQKPKIAKYVAQRMKEATISADEVLKRLSDQATSNLLPFVRFTEDGACFFDFSNPDAEKYFHLIKKVKTKRTRRLEGKGKDAEQWEDEWVEVELIDSQNALIQLAKHYHLINENLNLELNGKTISVTIKNDEG